MMDTDAFNCFKKSREIIYLNIIFAVKYNFAVSLGATMGASGSPMKIQKVIIHKGSRRIYFLKHGRFYQN